MEQPETAPDAGGAGPSFDLTRAQLELRDRARRFAVDRIAPGAAERYAAGDNPVDLLRELGRAGLLGIPVPAEFGGVGHGLL